MKKQINIVMTDGPVGLSLSGDLDVEVEQAKMHVVEVLNEAVLNACKEQDKAMLPPGKYSVKVLVSVLSL